MGMRPAFSWGAAAAPLFVFLWATGFIGAKYGLPYAEPLTFLALRFAIAFAILALWVAIVAAPALERRQWGRVGAIGVLNHGGYLGGMYVAMAWGLEAGAAALIAGLNPIFTAVIARARTGDRLSRPQVLGMLLGVLGVALVVQRKLAGGAGDVGAIALALCATAMFAYGAVEQKRLGQTPMASGNAAQYLAAGAVCALAALALGETGQIAWTTNFVLALGWLVFALSIGAISLYYILLQRGGAAEAASLMFLVPAVTAAIAWPLFGETLGAIEMIGVASACVGVGLVTGAITTPKRLTRRA